jgi:DNA-binding transcriptional LysR family regulator
MSSRPKASTAAATSARHDSSCVTSVTTSIALAPPSRNSDVASLFLCLTLSRNPGSASWPCRVDGKLTRIEVKGSVSADSADMLLRLAIAGTGILRLSEHVVAPAIHQGLLEPVLQDVQDPGAYPLFALQPPGRHQAPKVRVFIDFLVERLGSTPWRTGARPTASAGL